MAKSTTKSPKRSSTTRKRKLNPNAAGIDLGATQHYVAVPEDRDAQSVRHFGTHTDDLFALADWLQQCSISTVAMEATGVYWIPLFQVLEERGLEVYLVNARHVKHVPGRKTDVPLISTKQKTPSGFFTFPVLMKLPTATHSRNAWAKSQHGRIITPTMFP